MLEFDGVAYPHGSATEPVALGLMQGAPPQGAKQIRFQDDRLLRFPQIRWTLSHLRELMPTVSVWRGPGAATEIQPSTNAAESGIDALAFEDLRGRPTTWRESLEHTYTDGILV